MTVAIQRGSLDMAFAMEFHAVAGFAVAGAHPSW